MIVGWSITTFPKLKSSIDLKNGIQQKTITDEIGSNVDDAAAILGRPHRKGGRNFLIACTKVF